MTDELNESKAWSITSESSEEAVKHAPPDGWEAVPGGWLLQLDRHGNPRDTASPVPPVQPKHKPLTDDQINEAYGAARVQHDHIPHDDVVRIARAIEAAHGIAAPNPKDLPC